MAELRRATGMSGRNGEMADAEFCAACVPLCEKHGWPEWEFFDRDTGQTWQYRLGKAISCGLFRIECKDCRWDDDAWCLHCEATSHEAACLLHAHWRTWLLKKYYVISYSGEHDRTYIFSPLGSLVIVEKTEGAALIKAVKAALTVKRVG